MIALILTLLGLALGVQAQSAANCNAAVLAAALPAGSGATVNSATAVPYNGTYGGGAADIEFPTNATGLPSLCAVSINVPTPGNTSFNFGLFLPDEWNGRIMTTGNGGFGGGINWPDMGSFVHYGFSTVSTDTGHLSGTDDGTWALDQPEKLYNWGYRAMHETVVMAKQVVSYYYSQDIAYSYYAACSTGGRQGLKELQLYPDTFDGVIAGAPAWDMGPLQAVTLKLGLDNYPPNASYYIPPNLFPVIADEMVRQCDPQDGLVDGIINNPFACDFQFEQLLCTAAETAAGNTSACLTPAQLGTVYKAYNDYVDVNQTFISAGFALGADAGALMETPNEIGTDFYRYWVLNDSTWDYTTYTFADYELGELIRPGDSPADDYDLAPFRAAGGKLVMYHGLADELIPTATSLVFYRHVYAALLGQADLPASSPDDFYRMYFVPGMGHCLGSTAAPWYFGAASQWSGVVGAQYSVPGYMDPEHDVVLAMMRWVEEGQPPADIVATKFYNDTVADGVQIQRPLCAYPTEAKYLGYGDPSEPTSWACESMYY